MKVKLAATAQLELLRQGDIVMRFPTRGAPEDRYDENRKQHIDSYEIRSINADNQMIQLVMTGDSVAMCSLPGDIGHVFIKSYDLLSAGVWWI